MMTLSRNKFWIALQLVFFIIVCLYQLLWIVAGVETEGYVLDITKGSKDFPVEMMHVEYTAGDVVLHTTFLHDKDFHSYHAGETISLSYLSFARGSARLPVFTAGDALGIIVYLLLAFVTALIFVMPNYLIGKKSFFSLNSRFPFIRYHSGKLPSHAETVGLITRANLYAGYIEKFLLPFAGAAVIALVLYIATWSTIVVIICFIAGSVIGVIRARKWKRTLEPGDDELEVIDTLPHSTDYKKSNS